MKKTDLYRELSRFFKCEDFGNDLEIKARAEAMVKIVGDDWPVTMDNVKNQVAECGWTPGDIFPMNEIENECQANSSIDETFNLTDICICMERLIANGKIKIDPLLTVEHEDAQVVVKVTRVSLGVV